MTDSRQPAELLHREARLMTYSPMGGGTGAVPGRSPMSVLPEFDSGAGTAIHHWPHASALPLAALDTAPGCGRGHARNVLREWNFHRQLHSMRIGDGVRAGCLRRAEMWCDLAIQRGECVRRG